MPDNIPTPGGRPLDPITKKKMEAAFGADLSAVRIHQDGGASASSIQAKAYTHGNHITFQRGAYLPNTQQGQKVLAHEIAHVLQQRGPGQIKPEGDPEAEQEVKRIVDQALKRL